MVKCLIEKVRIRLHRYGYPKGTYDVKTCLPVPDIFGKYFLKKKSCACIAELTVKVFDNFAEKKDILVL